MFHSRKIIISVHYIIPSVNYHHFIQWEKLLYLLVVDLKSDEKSIITMEKPNQLQRLDYGRNILIQNGLFVIQGEVYHFLPICENMDESKCDMNLYKIDIQTRKINLVSMVQNYTLTGGLENYPRGFSIVPFSGLKSSYKDPKPNCALLD